MGTTRAELPKVSPTLLSDPSTDGFIAIVDLVRSKGGVMTMEDLAACDAQIIEPIKYDYKAGKSGDEGVTLWEASRPDAAPNRHCS